MKRPKAIWMLVNANGKPSTLWFESKARANYVRGFGEERIVRYVPVVPKKGKKKK